MQQCALITRQSEFIHVKSRLSTFAIALSHLSAEKWFKSSNYLPFVKTLWWVPLCAFATFVTGSCEHIASNQENGCLLRSLDSFRWNATGYLLDFVIADLRSMTLSVTLRWMGPSRHLFYPLKLGLGLLFWLTTLNHKISQALKIDLGVDGFREFFKILAELVLLCMEIAFCPAL